MNRLEFKIPVYEGEFASRFDLTIITILPEIFKSNENFQQMTVK